MVNFWRWCLNLGWESHRGGDELWSVLRSVHDPRLTATGLRANSFQQLAAFRSSAQLQQNVCGCCVWVEECATESRHKPLKIKFKMRARVKLFKQSAYVRHGSSDCVQLFFFVYWAGRRSEANFNYNQPCAVRMLTTDTCLLLCQLPTGRATLLWLKYLALSLTSLPAAPTTHCHITFMNTLEG